jgi:hypothetical protein
VNYHAAGTLFVLKAPFTTNSNYYKTYPGSADSALKNIQSVYKKMFPPPPQCPSGIIVPYMMLQVRVTKSVEAKLIFHNGVFHHFLSPSSKAITASFPGFSSDDVVNFASTAVQHLSSNDENIVDGLLRVDIFKNDEGKLVVNEFESLEARYFSTQQAIMMETEKFLNNYWEKKIYSSISSLPN